MSETTRRQLLIVGGSACLLGPLAWWLSGPTWGSEAGHETFPVDRTDAQWRETLGSDRYRILRDHGTERPFSSPLNHEKRTGTFVCAGCGQPLFSSATKFESGTGWPSFWEPLADAVGSQIDRSYFMVRTEVHCSRCGGHLGHLFQDGPEPTGLRYCINGLSLGFVTGRPDESTRMTVPANEES